MPRRSSGPGGQLAGQFRAASRVGGTFRALHPSHKKAGIGPQTPVSQRGFVLSVPARSGSQLPELLCPCDGTAAQSSQKRGKICAHKLIIHLGQRQVAGWSG
jgi:hypothetical protein